MMWSRLGAVLVMVIAIITSYGSKGWDMAKKLFSSGSISFEALKEVYDQLEDDESETSFSGSLTEVVFEPENENTTEYNYWQQFQEETTISPEMITEEAATEYHYEPTTEKSTEPATYQHETKPYVVQEEITPQMPEIEPATHTHKWSKITETVHHEAVTENRWVVDIPEWTEESVKTIPITEEVLIRVATCRMCGAAYEDADLDTAVSACHSHIIEVHDNACGYGLENSYYQTMQVGSQQVTEYINHPEVGHTEIVTVQETYDEVIITGYRCSCGETK